MTRLVRILLAALFAVALLTPGHAGAQGDGGHDGHSGGSGGQDGGDNFEMMMESIDELRDLSGKEFEVGYINRIVPHHEGAIEMAEIVVDKAPHQEVRDAAAKIIEDQQMEIDTLTGYLSAAYGQELDRDERQVMSHGMMQELEDASPEMAEKLFLLMMREHHETAVIMGGIVLDKEVSAEIRQQAEGMVASQQQEQEQFAEWLKTWYGIDAPEPTGDMMAAMQYLMGADMPDAGAGGLSGFPRTSLIVSLAVLAALMALAGGYGLRRRFR